MEQIDKCPNLKYYCDNKRHLICKPYSRENLHKMAEDLGIKRCWFHKDHYDIPKKRIEEITNKCILVSSRDIVKTINRKAKRMKAEKVKVLYHHNFLNGFGCCIDEKGQIYTRENKGDKFMPCDLEEFYETMRYKSHLYNKSMVFKAIVSLACDIDESLLDKALTFDCK